MRNLKFTLLVTLLAIGTFVQAQTQPIDENGLAIGGYDVVAYFSGEAKEGSEKYTAKYNDATYRFSSKDNLKDFKKNPQAYLPQYGGYCAWGVGAKNTKFPINPKTFDIIDGKLYLFYNGPFEGKTFNTLIPWNADTSTLIEEANSNWKNIK